VVFGDPIAAKPVNTDHLYYILASNDHGREVQPMQGEMLNTEMHDKNCGSAAIAWPQGKRGAANLSPTVKTINMAGMTRGMTVANRPVFAPMMISSGPVSTIAYK
jgi:hypothetical protein